MRWPVLLLAPLVLGLAAAPAGRAQADWAVLTPGVGGGGLAGEPLAPWSSGPGVAVRVEAPAYGGRARAEVRALAFSAGDPALPDFVLLMPALGWGPSLVAGPVRIGVGARVGIAQFRFDDDDAGNFKNETEAAVGGWAGATATLGRAEVWAEADVLRLALSEPTALVGLTGGVAVRLETPRWLRRVIE